MATTTIPWNDGSGDNIYLTYPSASGNQTVEVTSDANAGAARSKVVTFTSVVGSITQNLTISQAAGEPKPNHACITFRSSDSNTLALTKNGSSNPTLYTSTDGQTWTQWDGSAIAFSAGHPIFMYGDNTASFSSSTSNYSTFTLGGDGLVECSGDIMTLVDGTGTTKTIPRTYYFYRLFYGQRQLAKSPDLTATTLKNYCYRNMFHGCWELVSAPAELPATTLTQQCYYEMFRGCTSLVTAPVLPAITLASNCYNYMFYGCSSLQYVKAMFTTTPGSGYTTSWMSSVKNGGTFVKNKNAQWSVSGANGIPSSWTIVLE